MKELGMVALVVVGITVWLTLWIWFAGKLEEEYEINPLLVALGGGMVLPLLAFGIYALA